MIKKVRTDGTGFYGTRDTLNKMLAKIGLSTIDTGFTAQRDTLVQHGQAINANADELRSVSDRLAILEGRFPFL